MRPTPPAQDRHDYVLCSWHVRSVLPLPELPGWPGAADDAVDVVIEEAALPDRLDPAEVAGAWLSIGDDGSVLVQVPGLVRIHVLNGRLIRVQRLNSQDEGWRLFLLGTALGCLCLQRGLFPLHAACLRIGGRSVVIAGHSGAGKSTLSASLLERGHSLLSDDLAVIRIGEHGIELLPAFPRLKLWRDTLESLHLPVADLAQVRQGMDKFDLRPQAAFDAATIPLDAILILQDASELQLQRCTPHAALPLLHSCLARPQVAARLGLRAATFAQAAQIARQIPVWRLHRPRRFEALDATAELIEACLAS